MHDLDVLRAAAPPVVPLDPAAEARVRTRLRTPPRRRRRALLALMPAVTVVAIVGIPRLAGGGGSQPAFAAEAIRAAESSPLLLIRGDGWRITRVDEFVAGTGEMTASNGRSTIELGWDPSVSAPAATFFKANESDLEEQAAVAGAPATIYRYAGTGDYVAVWVDGPSTVHARGVASSPDAFVADLDRIGKVSVNDWLAALPTSAVKPADRGQVVDQMLDGLPLPPGLDVAALKAGATTRDRYQLAASVAGAVACGWIARWADAKVRGDEVARQKAAEALAGARGWTVLQSMRAEGAYPDILVEYADAVASGGHIVGVKAVSVEASYRDALGCATP